MPKGRKAEDGKIPDKFDQLTELDSNNYLVRTRQNVVTSDGTLILTHERNPSGGTGRTLQMCLEHGKPWWVANPSRGELTEKVVSWLKREQVYRLNLAGPRESKAPGIQKETQLFLEKVLQILDRELLKGV